jgi:hypothetical protein
VTDQTQDTRHEGAEPPRPPIPDLGFFAGSPTPSGGSPVFGGSPVGGAPSPFGALAASPFGTPAASPFGTPAASPFGAPAASPFGAPAPWAGAAGAPLQPTRSGLSTGWKAAAAAAAVVVLIGLVLGGRFGWQQFVADPVTPDTLMTMPKVTGPVADDVVAQFRSSMGDELSTGSTSEVAFYTDGRGSGYVLVAIRGGGGNDSGSGNSSEAGSTDPFAGWAKSTVGGTTCYSKPAQAAAGAGVTFCARGLWRRAVVVLGIADVPPAAPIVARATDEAWDAQ